MKGLIVEMLSGAKAGGQGLSEETRTDVREALEEMCEEGILHRATVGAVLGV